MSSKAKKISIVATGVAIVLITLVLCYFFVKPFRDLFDKNSRLSNKEIVLNAEQSKVVKTFSSVQSMVKNNLLGENEDVQMGSATDGSLDIEAFGSKLNYGFQLNHSRKNGLMATDFALTSLGQEMVNAEIIGDINNKCTYLKLKNANDKFMKIENDNLSDIIGFDISSIFAGAASGENNKAQVTDLMNIDFEQIIKDYTKVIIDNIDDFEKEASASGEISGVKYKDYSCYSVKLYADDFIKISDAICEKAKQDQNIKKLFEMSGESLTQEEYENLIDKVFDDVEDAEDDEESSEASEDDYVVYKAYIDDNNYIAGHEFTSYVANEAVDQFKIMTVNTKSDFAMDASIMIEKETVMGVSGNAKIDNGAFTGKFSIAAEESEDPVTIDLDIKDFKFEYNKDSAFLAYYDGTIDITVTSQEFSQTINCEFDKKDDGTQTIGISFKIDEQTAVSFSINSKRVEVKDISVPSADQVVEVKSADEIYEFIGPENLQKMLGSFASLGAGAFDTSLDDYSLEDFDLEDFDLEDFDLEDFDLAA